MVCMLAALYNSKLSNKYLQAFTSSTCTHASVKLLDLSKHFLHKLCTALSEQHTVFQNDSINIKHTRKSYRGFLNVFLCGIKPSFCMQKSNVLHSSGPDYMLEFLSNI